MGGFLSSIFGGSNPTLNKNIPGFQQEAGFGTSVGNADVTAASKWYSDLLSGDPTKEAEAIAPETAALQTQSQEAKNQRAQFGPRSGGTAAANADSDTAVRAQIDKLLGGLKSNAASGASSLGTAEQGIGIQSREEADNAAQQQMQNWQRSIFGGAIGGGADIGLEALSGFAGGG